MSIQLFKFNAHPEEIAVSKTGSFIDGSSFFLDFSRPLKYRRWLFAPNEFIGFAIGCFVPVVHQGEINGGYVVGVDRSDPYFSQIQALWRDNFPKRRQVVSVEVEPLKIVADFAAQFPEDCS